MCAFRLPLTLALTAILTIVPVVASADSIPVRGIFGISSHGGDFPDLEGLPLTEFWYSFGQLGPSLPGITSMSGDAFATSALHGTVGGLQVTRASLPLSLAAGSLYDLSTTATWTFGSLQDYRDYIGTSSYTASGAFEVNAGTAVLYGSEYQLNGTAPFTFTGFVSAFDRDTGATLFERRVRGKGTAMVYLDPSDPSRFTYRYEVTPVPEPATLLLLGTGMLGLLARRRNLRAAEPILVQSATPGNGTTERHHRLRCEKADPGFPRSASSCIPGKGLATWRSRTFGIAPTRTRE